MDECAPENVLEVTARAITYYLDVSAECTRRIVAVEGAIKALCSRLVVVDLSSRTSKDLGEQCVKVSLQGIQQQLTFSFRWYKTVNALLNVLRCTCMFMQKNINIV